MHLQEDDTVLAAARSDSNHANARPIERALTKYSEFCPFSGHQEVSLMMIASPTGLLTV